MDRTNLSKQVSPTNKSHTAKRRKSCGDILSTRRETRSSKRQSVLSGIGSEFNGLLKPGRGELSIPGDNQTSSLMFQEGKKETVGDHTASDADLGTFTVDSQVTSLSKKNEASISNGNDLSGISIRESSSSLHCSFEESNDDSHTASTQTMDDRPLKGLCFMVDVRSSNENRSQGVKKELEALGGQVVKKYSKEVTHVVFKEGRKTTLKMAEKHGLFLVSVLWVDSCKNTWCRVSETLFPAQKPGSKSSDLITGKLKRVKSLQPRTFTEDEHNSGKREARRKKREQDTLKVDCKFQLDGVFKDYFKYLTDSDHDEEELSSAVFDRDLFNHTGEDSSSALHTPHGSLAASRLERDPLNIKCCNSRLNDKESKEDITEGGKMSEKKHTVPTSGKVTKRKVLLLPRAPYTALRTSYPETSTDLGNNVTTDGETSFTESNRRKNEERKRKRPGKECGGQLVECVKIENNNAKKENGHSEQKQASPTTRSEASDKGETRQPLKYIQARRQKSRRLSSLDRADFKDCSFILNTESSSESDGRSLPRKNEKLQMREQIKENLVFTSLHASEQQFVRTVVKKMGRFHVSDQVTPSTTHVICGDNRRTLNVLFGTVQGCWLLSPEWVSRSFEKGEWIDESEEELSHWFPAAKISRESCLARKSPIFATLFSDLGWIYIAECTSPSFEDLVKLISMCGGRITNSLRKAKICVGFSRCHRDDVTVVREKWVLDCISGASLLGMTDYIIRGMDKKARSPSPEF